MDISPVRKLMVTGAGDDIALSPTFTGGNKVQALFRTTKNQAKSFVENPQRINTTDFQLSGLFYRLPDEHSVDLTALYCKPEDYPVPSLYSEGLTDRSSAAGYPFAS